MSLHKSVDDFPEAVGLMIACGCCHEAVPHVGTVSVRWLAQVSETKAQVQMSLLCAKCILINFKTEGAC